MTEQPPLGVGNGHIQAILGKRDKVLDGILRRSLLEERMPTIQVDDNAGRILQILTILHRPKVVVEIGALFAYSTIYIARGLTAGACITSFEIDPRSAELAQQNIARAGLSDRSTIICADAAEGLGDFGTDSIDMAFIDGDKKEYPNYLKLLYPRIRKGGLVIADDAFAYGDFAPGNAEEANLIERKGIESYNLAVGRSPHLFSALIGTQNGLMVSVKI